jgi:SpoVK/Ycf46/Vps4 family AAA+-type ATPase
MEHFEIIQSLCRIGLGATNSAFRHQVQRLHDALEEAGGRVEAATLARLLTATQKEANLKPSRVVLSHVEPDGEKLTSRVSPPVDRETGAALAEIHFLADEPLPIFDEQLDIAVRTLVDEWRHQDQLAKLGVEPPRSCLFFGPPGTGKTRLAFWVASQLHLPLITARLDGLVSSFLGTTARNIANLFDFANRYRCILLLDEFDALAKLRDDPQEVGEIKRVVNTLLQNLDLRSRIGLSLAITNHEQLLDRAVWRRFETRISIPLPGATVRQSIVAAYLPPLEIDSAGLRFLAWATDGLTGAEIEIMTRSIKRHAAMRNGSGIKLFEALRAHALTNAGKDRLGRHALLLGSKQDLARALMAEPELGFTQQILGTLLERDQATISRWLRAEPVTAQKDEK